MRDAKASLPSTGFPAAGNVLLTAVESLNENDRSRGVPSAFVNLKGYIDDRDESSAASRRRRVRAAAPLRNPLQRANRYGLTNEDLNRRWSSPTRTYHPVIYHTKGLMEYCARVLQRPPHVFVDYHGHSRRKNVFLFGCSRSGSWSAADRAKPDQPVQYLMLPHLMQRTSPAFALQLCSFKVERNKESTARVAVWRQLGVPRSYTMESSFCGCDQGVLAGLHLDTEHLKAIGRDFCQALSMMKDGGDDWAIGKIPLEKHIPVESRCMDNDVSSSKQLHVVTHAIS
ncbi:Cytosolic carboxypeptidase 1 [Temnothorax longispinosus]|uniref:Cytosolic carboxypeptidase 1 n=1 Tax=Temnothorax longispinosus TaxID=300112 RepID=A0A4S2L718_9HYME|nr:Cytosolic carboxypeptidase 1 [Temnothorax longispinosus]